MISFISFFVGMTIAGFFLWIVKRLEGFSSDSSVIVYKNPVCKIPLPKQEKSVWREFGEE